MDPQFDPNFFHVDLERAFEVFVAIVLLSLILERSLALIFEHRWYVKKFKDKGYKTFIAFGIAYYLCYHWKFDALSIIVLQEHNLWAGYALTAGVIAGGSKASIALFHDFLNVRSTVMKEQEAEAAEKKKKGQKEGDPEKPESETEEEEEEGKK